LLTACWTVGTIGLFAAAATPPSVSLNPLTSVPIGAGWMAWLSIAPLTVRPSVANREWRTPLPV
jgi:hypothetical protein